MREMTDEELLSNEQELRETCFNLKIQKASGDLVNTARLKLVKKDLARVLGMIRERNINREVVAGKGPGGKKGK